MISVADLAGSENPLARHYGHFRVAERLLLTGHSHQAWPDVGLEAQRQAWIDAAEHVDEKWMVAAERAERVRAGFRERMSGCDGDIVLDSNTHALVVRLLSALPLRDRPRIVTTGGEFHSLRRQLDRLGEEGVEIVRVSVEPLDSLTERVAAEVDDRTAAAALSSVLFETGRVVPNLPLIAEACDRHGAELLVDAYHSIGVIPFPLAGLDRAFVVGGGYKYCQLGEGNCFLRVPPGCDLRPVVTGWFAEFAELEEPVRPGAVSYASGVARFAGSTFDPTSHYRAAAVFDFFTERGLGLPLLREISQHQIGMLVERFEALDVDPTVARLDPIPLESRAGFLAIHTDRAGELAASLRARGVRTDFRGDVLRFGPAPYLRDDQLVTAMGFLGELLG